MDKLFAGCVVVALYFGICYAGFLIHRKPGETFLSYLGDCGSFMEPLQEDLARLNRGEVIRK